jgi:hypothetical protein
MAAYKLVGHLKAELQTGTVPRCARSWGRFCSLHEPDVHPQVFGSARTCPRFVSTRHVASRKAATCRRTPKRCRGNWFMVPMHVRKRKEAFHELPNIHETTARTE